jgi:pantothenate kinase-related protein Tda10
MSSSLDSFQKEILLKELQSLVELSQETSNMLDNLRYQYTRLIRAATSDTQREHLVEEFKKQFSSWIDYQSRLETKRLLVEVRLYS